MWHYRQKSGRLNESLDVSSCPFHDDRNATDDPFRCKDNAAGSPRISSEQNVNPCRFRSTEILANPLSGFTKTESNKYLLFDLPKLNILHASLAM